MDKHAEVLDARCRSSVENTSYQKCIFQGGGHEEMSGYVGWESVLEILSEMKTLSGSQCCQRSFCFLPPRFTAVIAKQCM